MLPTCLASLGQEPHCTTTSAITRLQTTFSSTPNSQPCIHTPTVSVPECHWELLVCVSFLARLRWHGPSLKALSFPPANFPFPLAGQHTGPGNAPIWPVSVRFSRTPRAPFSPASTVHRPAVVLNLYSLYTDVSLGKNQRWNGRAGGASGNKRWMKRCRCRRQFGNVEER